MLIAPAVRFSALQRAEIAEMYADKAFVALRNKSFSALQRAEIAEIEPERKRDLG